MAESAEAPTVPLNFSTFLFTDELCQPIIFVIRPSATKATLRKIIESGGGEVISTSKHDPTNTNAIKILAEGDECTSSDYYSHTYIDDCVAANTLLDKSNYRVKCSTGKGGESLVTEIAVNGSPKGRMFYTQEEDEAILQYIAKHPNESGGNAIWRKMEVLKITKHTWQSMKDHFRKKLERKLKKYILKRKKDLDEKMKQQETNTGVKAISGQEESPSDSDREEGVFDTDMEIGDFSDEEVSRSRSMLIRRMATDEEVEEDEEDHHSNERGDGDDDDDSSSLDIFIYETATTEHPVQKQNKEPEITNTSSPSHEQQRPNTRARDTSSNSDAISTPSKRATKYDGASPYGTRSKTRNNNAGVIVGTSPGSRVTAGNKKSDDGRAEDVLDVIASPKGQIDEISKGVSEGAFQNEFLKHVGKSKVVAMTTRTRTRAQCREEEAAEKGSEGRAEEAGGENHPNEAAEGMDVEEAESSLQSSDDSLPSDVLSVPKGRYGTRQASRRLKENKSKGSPAQEAKKQDTEKRLTGSTTSSGGDEADSESSPLKKVRVVVRDLEVIPGSSESGSTASDVIPLKRRGRRRHPMVVAASNLIRVPETQDVPFDSEEHSTIVPETQDPEVFIQIQQPKGAGLPNGIPDLPDTQLPEQEAEDEEGLEKARNTITELAEKYKRSQEEVVGVLYLSSGDVAMAEESLQGGSKSHIWSRSKDNQLLGTDAAAIRKLITKYGQKAVRDRIMWLES